MHYFGVSATRLQMATLIVMALALGGCKMDSGTGSTSSAPQNASMGTATLMWVAPAANTNGSPLTDLAGYHIRYGTSPDSLTRVIDLAGSGATEFEVSGLTPGTYYFSVSAYTSMGTESAESDVESKRI
jgi:hypothetical protein